MNTGKMWNASWICLLLFTGNGNPLRAEVPAAVQSWLQTRQDWRRDTTGPIVSLSPPRAFDDTHIFAPLVAFENGQYRLWYCGSTASVQQRVFQLGLALSRDGRRFHKYGQNPVYAFGDGKHSILTPTLLRRPDGGLLREDGRLRMWFSSTWFSGGGGLHTLHQATSPDGLAWSRPSTEQMRHVYAPTIIKENGAYRMWYCDVAQDPWVIRHAGSVDGVQWRVTPRACLVIDQAWEQKRLFYPTVLQIGGVYQIWYGSYWSKRPNTTAIGFAASTDGLSWHKHPGNPVLRPDPQRSWESHYVTSQSVMRMPDGAFRIWYASRKKPPFVNKYFAINTAIWERPDAR